MPKKTLLKLKKQKSECFENVDILDAFYGRFEDCTNPSVQPVLDLNLELSNTGMVHNVFKQIDASKSLA